MIRVPASRSLGKHQAKKPCVIGNMHVWFYFKKNFWIRMLFQKKLTSTRKVANEPQPR
jgi:hypothetical protein